MDDGGIVERLVRLEQRVDIELTNIRESQEDIERALAGLSDRFDQVSQPKRTDYKLWLGLASLVLSVAVITGTMITNNQDAKLAPVVSTLEKLESHTEAGPEGTPHPWGVAAMIQRNKFEILVLRNEMLEREILLRERLVALEGR